MHNTDITKLSLPSYRSHISLVSQEPSIFSGTIRSNILLGVDPSTPDIDTALHAACQQADIHTFITSLPSGYSTEVGARGIALSGGQKQRIAIARALIRNPRVLLLDEATSNLDSETEREVQRVFEESGKGKGRTMVVVAHRLATVQNADVIFVVEGGRVVEKGNHGELLGLRGVYWQMVRQFPYRCSGQYRTNLNAVPSPSSGQIGGNHSRRSLIITFSRFVILLGNNFLLLDVARSNPRNFRGRQ